MSYYTKHTFVNGQWLFAKELNEMDDQIAKNAEKGDTLSTSIEQEIARAKAAEKTLNNQAKEQEKTLDSMLDDIVLMQNNPPTGEHNRLWIDTSEMEQHVIPEIDDAHEKNDDTWSSRKIAAEINKVLQLHESVKVKQDEILRALSTINARLDALAQNTEEA